MSNAATALVEVRPMTESDVQLAMKKIRRMDDAYKAMANAAMALTEAGRSKAGHVCVWSDKWAEFVTAREVYFAASAGLRSAPHLPQGEDEG